jgi:hypothetical protein
MSAPRAERARSGEQWVDLFITRAGTALNYITVRVRRVHDPIVCDSYNLSQHKLVLSSQSRQGRPVREVAEFATTGC